MSHNANRPGAGRIIRTVRRASAEAAVNLRQRRAWFDDTPDPATPEQAQPAPESKTDPSAAEPQEISQLPSWAQKIIADARKGEANYRNQLRDIETAKQEADRKAAEEQGQFKDLWEKAQPQLAEYKALKEREEQRRASVKERNEQRLKELPKDKREKAEGLIATIGVDDPDKIANVLDTLLPELNAQPPAPKLDGGAKGDRGGSGSADVKLNRVSY